MGSEKDGIVDRATCRIHGRKLWQSELGYLRAIESDIASEYLQAILDCIFTGIMMIDVTVAAQFHVLTVEDRDRFLEMTRESSQHFNEHRFAGGRFRTSCGLTRGDSY